VIIFGNRIVAGDTVFACSNVNKSEKINGKGISPVRLFYLYALALLPFDFKNIAKVITFIIHRITNIYRFINSYYFFNTAIIII